MRETIAYTVGLGAADDQLAVGKHVAAQDRAGGHDGAVADAHRPDGAALPAEKDRRAVEHDAARDVAEQRRSRLIAVGREIEVDV